MHRAVPRCDDCGEPIRRYVESFSGVRVSEEVIACDCEAVTLVYDRGGDPPDETIPACWQ